MSGMLGRKIGMTSVFDDQGNNIPCTVIEAGPNVVTQVKRADGQDGYDAVQIGFADKKEKRTTKALRGHFEAAGVSPKKHLREFRQEAEDLDLGDELRVDDVFEEGELIDVVRRHNFSGVGDRTHGQHNRERAPGSIGASSDPSRVFKGTRMGGQMGNQRVKVKNLRVVRLVPEHNLILVRGAVPGPKNGFIELFKKS